MITSGRPRKVDARRYRSGKIVPAAAGRDHGTPELRRHKVAVFGGESGASIDRMSLDASDPIHLFLARGLLTHDQAIAARDLCGLYCRAIGKPYPRTGTMGITASGSPMSAHDRLVAERSLDECYDTLTKAGGIECLRAVNRYCVHGTWDWLPEDVRRHRAFRSPHFRRFQLLRVGLDALQARRRVSVSTPESALAAFQELTGQVAP